MSRGLSPKLPLSFDPSDGYTLNKEFKEMIKQNLKMLILTNPGERIMLPDFGVGLRRYLFEPNIETKAQIEARIESQIAEYMPFIELDEIQFGDDILSDSAVSVLNIRLDFLIKPLDIFSYIELSVET